jgi:hypothetical protein
MPLNTRVKWEYVTLVGRKVSYLGAEKLFENKGDSYASDRHAWDDLERGGWELVSVVSNQRGELIHYFKRRVEE